LESFRHCRTLILDRDILVSSQLQETLKLIGFRMILTASRVDTARLLVREAYCDLVLLDWPSHRFFLKALRAEHGRQSPIIIAMGPDKDPRRLLSSIREGADAFINIPVSNAQMLITMKRLLMDFVPPVRNWKVYSAATVPDQSTLPDDRACECTILRGDFRSG
jgi:DNA-binding NarL/FixJ family response regulator